MYNGGGLIGIGEPSAYAANGRYFVLADVLGVDKETGLSLSTDKYNLKPVGKHFILEDVREKIDYGESMKSVYAYPETSVLDIDRQDVLMSVHDYGKGRAFYMTGLPYNVQNERILYRALHYVAHKESEIYKWFCEDTAVICQYYPQINECAVVNNSDREVNTKFYDGNGRASDITLAAGELKWLKF